jgi:hypothetical protein
MSNNNITFATPQTVTLVAKEEVSGVNDMTPRRFIIDLVPVEGSDDNIQVHALFEGARVPLKCVCGSDQAAANTAFQPVVDTLVAQLKSAVEAGDYS